MGSAGVGLTQRHFAAVVRQVSVQIERPSQRHGPNVWLLFPPYLGGREKFAGFCEDQGGRCACTGVRGDCTHPLCRGKRLCATPPRGSAAFVDAARSFAAVARPGCTCHMHAHVM